MLKSRVGLRWQLDEVVGASSVTRWQLDEVVGASSVTGKTWVAAGQRLAVENPVDAGQVGGRRSRVGH